MTRRRTSNSRWKGFAHYMSDLKVARNTLEEDYKISPKLLGLYCGLLDHLKSHFLEINVYYTQKIVTISFHKRSHQ